MDIGLLQVVLSLRWTVATAYLVTANREDYKVGRQCNGVGDSVMTGQMSVPPAGGTSNIN